MPFNINAFVSTLRTMMYERFPREEDFINDLKHKGRTKHIRDVAFYDNMPMILSDNIIQFEIGNDESEEYYPYYHILEDAPVIRKRGRGTDRTKGSQRLLPPLERDYGQVNWNGKMFTKEYSKNIRGARARVVDHATRFVTVRGIRYKYNPNSDSYKNVHYHYIERMLSNIAPIIASDYEMQFVGTKGTGLKEEYVIDNYAIDESMGYDAVSELVDSLRFM